MANRSLLETAWLNKLGIPNANRNRAIWLSRGIRYPDAIDSERNIVYLFHGDYWHGNPAKYAPDVINLKKHCTMGDLFRRTMADEKLYRDEGFRVISVWESEFLGRVCSDYQRLALDRANERDRCLSTKPGATVVLDMNVWIKLGITNSVKDGPSLSVAVDPRKGRHPILYGKRFCISEQSRYDEKQRWLVLNQTLTGGLQINAPAGGPGRFCSRHFETWSNTILDDFRQGKTFMGCMSIEAVISGMGNEMCLVIPLPTPEEVAIQMAQSNPPKRSRRKNKNVTTTASFAKPEIKTDGPDLFSTSTNTVFDYSLIVGVPSIDHWQDLSVLIDSMDGVNLVTVHRQCAVDAAGKLARLKTREGYDTLLQQINLHREGETITFQLKM